MRLSAKFMFTIKQNNFADVGKGDMKIKKNGV